MVGIPASAPSAEGGFLAGVPRASRSGHCWPQGTGQSGRGPWLCLAHSRLLRGWPGARVPEGRREPFKETFLCLKKKKKRQETLKHTTKLVGWLASCPGMHSCGWWVEEATGGQQAMRGTQASGPRTGGPQLPLRSQSSAGTGEGPGLRSHFFHCLGVVLG